VRPFADGSGRPEQRIADLERQLAELRPGANKGGYLTPEQVHNVAFSKPPMGRRGYNEDEVDAFLDLIEQQVKSQRAAPLPRRQAGPPPPPPTGRLPARHGGGPRTRFRRFIDA
jgi:DivIVA domain-containing protein